MKRDDFQFSVPDHAAHLNGYMDAVGRVLSPGWELVSLGANVLQPDDDVESVVGSVLQREVIENWSIEFSTEFVTRFLGLPERERLGFYLLDLICDFEMFTHDAMCFKLDCAPKSDRILGQLIYLLELESSQRVLLWAMRSVRAAVPPDDSRG